jgi:hypothetical protein
MISRLLRVCQRQTTCDVTREHVQVVAVEQLGFLNLLGVSVAAMNAADEEIRKCFSAVLDGDEPTTEPAEPSSRRSSEATR